MDKVKSEILRQLGLSSAPNVTASKNFSNLPVIQKQILEFQRLESEEGFQNDYHQFDSEDNFWLSRVKRTTSRFCSEDFDPEVTQCCRWPLIIDFKEIGWDWVLSPLTFDMGNCAGDCSLGNVVNSPYVQMDDIKRTKCTPIRMSPMRMLYLDADLNIIKGWMPNMRVDSCGCS